MDNLYQTTYIVIQTKNEKGNEHHNLCTIVYSQISHFMKLNSLVKWLSPSQVDTSMIMIVLSCQLVEGIYLYPRTEVLVCHVPYASFHVMHQ